MTQRVIDLDEAMPESTIVKLEGESYELPPDIPIPTFQKIERLVEKIDAREGDVAKAMVDLYEKVLDLFRELNELPTHEVEGEDGEITEEEYLPLGARRMGMLIVGIYSGGLEKQGGDRPPKPRGGTRNTKKTSPKRSRSTRS
jgi:hypothetical protein